MLAGKGKGTRPVPWNREVKEAFNDIHQALHQNAVLYTPLPNRPFCLYTDSLDRGLGAVLTQDTPSGEQPVFFLSHKLSKAERNYAVVGKGGISYPVGHRTLKYYL